MEDSQFEALAAVETSYVTTEGKASSGTIHWIESSAMGRSFPALLVQPTLGLPHELEAAPIVFLLHGRNRLEVSERGLREMYDGCRLQEIADAFRVILVAPMVGNTGYLDSPIFAESKFGTFLVGELPREVDRLLRRDSRREQRILCGFSMGGYGALSALCRAPETFSAALVRGAVCDYATGVLDLGWDDAAIADEFLGSYWPNQKAYEESSCLQLVDNLRHRRDVKLILEVGQEDFLVATNRKMRDRLAQMGLPHLYSEVPGGHEFGPEVIFSLLTSLREWPGNPIKS